MSRSKLNDEDTSKKKHRHHRSGSHSHHREHKSGKVKKASSSSTLWKILGYFIIVFHYILDYITEIILKKYWDKKEVCPPPDSSSANLVAKSAIDLADLIRNKKVKSYDVVKAYIERIKQVNPLLNAVVDGPFTDALDTAHEIDQRLENNDITEDELQRKPFLGVPFTTKDSTMVKGKLHTLGLTSRKDWRAKEDAEYVQLLKDAGAIIIATSNIPEVNKWVESRNMLIGQTNNPYDTRRTVGGSSGGEAALVTSCATAFGIGTDTGGSIRIPSFFCGIFGHKPTTGCVSTRGITFRSDKERASTVVVAGPMARYAKDLLPILKVIVERDQLATLKLDEKVDVSKLKYYYIPENRELRTSPISRELQTAMYKACNHISELTGEKVRLVYLPGIDQTSRLWRHWLTKEPELFVSLLGNGVKLVPIFELCKKLIGKSEFTMAAIYCLIDTLLPKENSRKMDEIIKKCGEELEKLLGDDGVLLYPSAPHVAPYHYFPLVKMFDFHYFSLWNVLDSPATQVPLGLNSRGLPLGIQIVATKHRDRHCLAVAEELEKAFSGWVPPFRGGLE